MGIHSAGGGGRGGRFGVFEGRPGCWNHLPVAGRGRSEAERKRREERSK